MIYTSTKRVYSGGDIFEFLQFCVVEFMRISSQLLKLEEQAMFKKTIVLCLALSSGLFLGVITDCFAATGDTDTLNQAKQNIVSFIDSGKIAEANKAIEGIMAMPMSKEKGAALQQIAGAYLNAGQFDKAIEVSDYVLNKWPHEDFAIWSAMSMTLSRFGKEDLTAANSTTDLIIADYTNNPDLPQVLPIIADIYSWRNMYEKAERLYGIAIDKVPNGPSAAKARLGMSGARILRFIESRNYSLAEQQTSSLIANFARNPDLSGMLYRIAEKYQWSGKFEDAKGVYQQIAQNYPDSSYASKANLGISRIEVMSLIMSQDFTGAKKDLDQLVDDFSGNPDLPETLYWIAERYRWSSKFEEEKSIYQLIQNQPDNSYISKAKLGIARADIMSLIMAKDKDFVGAKKALDKLVTDFSGNPDLPETLGWIAERYEWLSRYEDSKRLYKQIAQNFPESSYASKARLNASRANVMSLMASQGSDQNEGAFNKMIADFNSNAELPQALLKTGQNYFMDAKAPDSQKARGVYERIIRDYPNTPEADNAVLDNCRLDIWDALNSDNENAAQVLMDKFVADFNQHPYASECLSKVAIKFYMKGTELKSMNQPDSGTTAKSPLDNKQSDLANACFSKAVDVWERMINQLPPSSATAEACYFTAVCCREHLREYEKAIIYYQKTLDDWPDYEYAWHAQYSIGDCYEKLLEMGALTKFEAMPKIINAYKTVVEKYPNCRKAKGTILKLEELGYQAPEKK
jgi:tetratricopeptide (TPR) repeat protein